MPKFKLCLAIAVVVALVGCGGEVAPTVVPDPTVASGPEPTATPPTVEFAAPPAVIGAASVEPPTDPPAPQGPIDVPTIRTFEVGSGPIALLYHDGAMMVVNQVGD